MIDFFTAGFYQSSGTGGISPKAKNMRLATKIIYSKLMLRNFSVVKYAWERDLDTAECRRCADIIEANAENTVDANEYGNMYFTEKEKQQ